MTGIGRAFKWITETKWQIDAIRANSRVRRISVKQPYPATANDGSWSEFDFATPKIWSD